MNNPAISYHVLDLMFIGTKQCVSRGWSAELSECTCPSSHYRFSSLLSLKTKFLNSLTGCNLV